MASAGTGKTASLVLRYLELISGGTPLRRIAGVTFTRKAADGLRVRVGQAIEDVLATGRHLSFSLEPSVQLVGTQGFAPASLRATEGLEKADLEPFLEARRELSGASISTIHGFMGHCLRLAAPMMNLDPDFSVLGDWEARAVFEEEWNSLRYLAQDPDHALHEVADEALTEPMLHLFGKRSLVETYAAAEGEANQTLLEVYNTVFSAYERRLGARLLSPSELERRAIELTRRPKALERVLERVQVLLVDEYQDVNPLQGQFFEALEGGGVEVEVVGDPKQSIYAFRNADVAVFRKALHEGKRLEPLTRSYRHSTTLVRFLNRLTDALSGGGLGFGPDEAPETHGVRQERGRLELHWVEGETGIDALREREAEVLAARLMALNGPIGYSQMAVLVRSYASVPYLEAAFKGAGVPYVLLQGRGYYERQEVRDLYHALRAALDPRGLSLAVWLRGPFGQVRGSGVGGRANDAFSSDPLRPLTGLELSQIDRILRAESPAEALKVEFPEVYARLAQIQSQLRVSSPLDLLKFVVREPLIEGRRYQDFLEPRARENVDALLFYFAARLPQSLEALLERLELLSKQADAGDVPQSGEGVQILTVHRAKGLEWPLVAVFDLGRKGVHQSQPVYLGFRETGEGSEPEDSSMLPSSPFSPPALSQPGTLSTGVAGPPERLHRNPEPLLSQFALPDTPHFETFKAQVKMLEDEETYRLLYVAVSRARDILLLTGSVREGKPEGWAAVLSAMGLGPDGQPFDRPDYLHKTWAYRPPEPHRSPPTLEAAKTSPWIHARFETEPFPPLFSPSALKREESEPLPLPDPEEGEEIPGRARAIGTLVHYAIGQNWNADNTEHLRNLEAQEVMFPFDPDEREGIMTEVRELLRNYQNLLGNGLLWPRDEDYPEFAVALPLGTTVWQGVMDRLYRVGETWVLEDYKTDREVRPERYHFQLGVYLEAIRQAWGVEPEVQLVYLRFGEAVRLEKGVLEAAVNEVKLGIS